MHNSHPENSPELLSPRANSRDNSDEIIEILSISKRQQNGELGSGKAMTAIIEIVGQNGTHQPLSARTQRFLRETRQILDDMKPGDTKIDFTENLAQLIQDKTAPKTQEK